MADKATVQFEDGIFAGLLADLRHALGKLRFKRFLPDGRVEAVAEYSSLKELAVDWQAISALEDMCREDELARTEEAPFPRLPGRPGGV